MVEAMIFFFIRILMINGCASIIHYKTMIDENTVQRDERSVSERKKQENRKFQGLYVYVFQILYFIRFCRIHKFFLLFFSFNFRVKANDLNLFNDSHYAYLKSISEVLDKVCMCKKIVEDDGIVTHRTECNFGTYKDCKFVVGKQYFCILNPEGQLRRKRDLRHLESIFSKSKNMNGPDLTVSLLPLLNGLIILNITRLCFRILLHQLRTNSSETFHILMRCFHLL